MPSLADYRLRPMQQSDQDPVLAWRNQTHIRAVMFTDDIITPQQHAEWFARTLRRADVDYRILLYRDKPAGLANATNFNPKQKSCYWGFYLGEPDLPKGSGMIMGILMLKHIFKSHDIDTVYSEVFDFNTASLKLHDKLGFVTLADKTRNMLKNNNEHAVLTLTLDRKTWLRNQDQLIETIS